MRFDLLDVAQRQCPERRPEAVTCPIGVEVQASSDDAVGIVAGPQIADSDAVCFLDDLFWGFARSNL